MATKDNDSASIDVTKPKLEKFCGNNRDTLDIKTWCLQVSRLDQVQNLGDENTATIVMEALREQALNWALLLEDKKPESAASWKLLQPLLLEHFGKSRSAIFSTCDLTSGFWQQSLQEKSRQYTAFSGLLRARQGSQVPVEGHADGITGIASVVRETDEFCHDGGKKHDYVH
jgi:hypothetical protein